MVITAKIPDIHKTTSALKNLERDFNAFMIITF